MELLWRLFDMDIFFDTKHDELIEEIVNKERVFNTLMELACFAATIGWDTSTEVISKSRSKTAPERVFHSNEKSGLVYLIGVARKKSIECLRDENISWREFQISVDIGMMLLNQWCCEHPSKSKSEVILFKMLEKAELSLEDNGSDIDISEIDLV